MERITEYIGFRGRYCDIVQVDCNWYDYRNNEPKLPGTGMFCKKCAKNTAKPVLPIYMNGREAYALHCNKCGSEYSVYKTWYNVHSGAGTHRTKQGNRQKQIEEGMCTLLNCSHEEYRSLKKNWQKEDAKFIKALEREQAETASKRAEQKLEVESNNRKKLIAEGVLKYVKNVGLVNTATGEVAKL